MHLQVCDGHNKTVNRKDKEGQLGVALDDHKIPRSLLIVLTKLTLYLTGQFIATENPLIVSEALARLHSYGLKQEGLPTKVPKFSSIKFISSL